MAYISVTGTTETSITVKLAGLDTKYDKSDRKCSWYLNSSYKGQTSIGAKASSSSSFTFSGLTAGTSYSIEAYVSPQDVYFYGSATTNSKPKPTVTEWSWFTSNGSATAPQTLAAYNAVTGKGSVRNFSYLVWNDLVDKVNAKAVSLGSSWLTNYASLSETKMTAWDKKLTAKRFNSLKFNIGARQSTGINDVSSGSVVYGWYFTTLASKLNTWIRS